MENNNPIDKENLRAVILDSPNQFKIGFEIAENVNLPGDFKSITISGMGGSCLPGDILRDFLENNRENLEIIQNRTYSLPQNLLKNSLHFFLSYSGNTEETLSSLDEALKKNLPCICFGSGGKLIEIAREKGLPHIVIPSGIQPRYATGYFFSSMLKVLKNCNLINTDLSEIEQDAEKMKNEMEQLEENGKKIAEKLKEKTPVIYATDKFKSVAMVIKIKINENAKTPAFWNYYPELNHNEMVGFTLPQAKFHILNIVDQAEHPQNIKRIEITSNLFKEKGIESDIIKMNEGAAFEKIFSTLILGDWISYYLALAYNQDPTPVEMVENLKKNLI